MNHVEKPIEAIFLESLLKLCLISVLIITGMDFYFSNFNLVRSEVIDLTILLAIVWSYLLYKRGNFILAVLHIGFITMAAMFYQNIVANGITSSSMAVVLIIGFGFSVLLKSKTPLILHCVTLMGMVAVFTWMALHPIHYGKPKADDIIVTGVTYCILYMVIAYSSWILKQRYDTSLEILASTNIELIEKTNEIETQNEELLQSQQNLYQLNNHLEEMVERRTKEVHRQNEQLIKYAYSNAHHLRGPVARVLGLIQLSKMKTDLDYPELFQKIEVQTNEIDEVVKSINKELER